MPVITNSSAMSQAELKALLVAMLADFGGLNGSATLDVASLVDGAGATSTVTVTGAALGDFVMVSLGVDVVGLTVSGYVSAANTVSVRVQNESGSTVDLASTTVRARVIPKTPTVTLA